MAQQLFFQTIQPTRAPTPNAPSADGVGAGVKLLHKASKALNGWAVEWRVNQEIDKLRPRIEAAIAEVDKRFHQTRPDAGALLVVGIQEWERPDPTGTRAQTFLSLGIAGSGTSAPEVMRRYRSQPQLVAGAPAGWRRREQFIWVTRSTL